MTPMGYRFELVTPDRVLVVGYASEPFSVTMASCIMGLARLKENKSRYSVGEYDGKRSVYLEAAKLAGWEACDPEAQIEPKVEPEVKPEEVPVVVQSVNPVDSSASPAEHIPPFSSPVQSIIINSSIVEILYSNLFITCFE